MICTPYEIFKNQINFFGYDFFFLFYFLFLIIEVMTILIAPILCTTYSGLDLFSYEAELKTLRMVESKRFNVSWYVYTHESRMVLLSTGMQCKSFSAFQVC